MYLFITQSELLSRTDHCEGEEALSLPGTGGDFPCEGGRQFSGRQSCFLFLLLNTASRTKQQTPQKDSDSGKYAKQFSSVAAAVWGWNTA